jgi:hypothetical protein
MSYGLSFTLGQTVWLKSCPDQTAWMIQSVMINMDGGVAYKLCQGIVEYWALEGEISEVRDELKKVTQN